MNVNEWVSYAPSDGGKNMIQIGTYGSTTSTAEVCTTIYERHHSDQDRATWEATGDSARQESVPWRTYGYCCSGMLIIINADYFYIIIHKLHRWKFHHGEI